LYDLTLDLRARCPWDQAQTAGTIVPHTLEEAYEVADVVADLEAGDASPADLEDELGDLLFQVCFLSMLLQERDASIDLGTVADGIRAKLVRRHPHIYGDQAAASDADDVRGRWEQVKREQEGKDDLFDGIPRAMPGVARARKLQSRAAASGFDFPSALAALDKLEEEVAEVREAITSAMDAGTMPTGEQQPPDARVAHEAGDVLFAAVNVARLARVDPELAVSSTSRTFEERVRGAIRLAAEEGLDWRDLDLDAQESWYQRAKLQRQ
jgi:MazG family protein